MATRFCLYWRLNQFKCEENISDDNLVLIQTFYNFPKCLNYLQKEIFIHGALKKENVYIVKKIKGEQFQHIRCNTYKDLSRLKKEYSLERECGYYGCTYPNDNFTSVFYKYTYDGNKWKETGHRTDNECLHPSFL